ncbi:MAG: DUF4402 domain-containing protein [Pacificimonas sp.]|jgi:hypothetical protein|nr:DUF4402 domain-containing protein [Pacificimonas sp.]
MTSRCQSFVTRIAAAMALCLVPGAVGAQEVSISVSSATADLGTLVTGSANSRYRITPQTGAVTQTAGDGLRLSTGSVASALVTISCNGTTFCDTDNIELRVGTNRSNSGKFRNPQRFRVQMGTASVDGGQSGGAPRRFQIDPVPDGQSRTFFVGFDILERGSANSRPYGATSGNYEIEANHVSDPGNVVSASGSVLGTVLRPIGASQDAVLDFGAFTVDSGSSATVTINASSGVRTITGTGVTGLAGQAGSRGILTVTGEGGQAISVTAPGSIALTNGTDNLTANLSTDTPLSTNLSSTPGNEGTVSYGIGGSITISGSPSGGSYTGSAVVTVQYN